MSDAGSVILQGDATRRVTVPLPRTLPELQYHAQRHFAGNRGNPRMFHFGEKPIHHPHHVGRIKDQDVIVVEKSQNREQEAPPLTMHQTDFIKHPMEAKSAMPPPPQPLPSSKFDANTSYKTDYIKHPLGLRKPVHPPQSGFLTGRPDGNTGQSTYNTHYPWHDAAPRSAFHPAQGVPNSNAPFDGVTSYKNDYVKHPLRPRSAAPTEKPRALTLPFEATTTYNNDFQNVPSARTAPAPLLKPALRSEGAPFEGSSEYKREYIELPRETRPMIHLEPEMRREARTRSTPGRKSR